MDVLARWFFKTGAILLLIGGLLRASKRLKWIGRVPGDLEVPIAGRPVRLPLGTSAILALIVAV